MNKNKPRILLVLRHRNSLSLPPNRERLNREAYHWSLIIVPKKTPRIGTEYDATDALVQDPVTLIYTNEEQEWIFREREHIAIDLDMRVIGTIGLGKISPARDGAARILGILKAVPLPVKGQSPNQSCVKWTLDALGELQKAAMLRGFDIEAFADWALEKGDEWMKDLRPGNFCEYKG